MKVIPKRLAALTVFSLICAGPTLAAAASVKASTNLQRGAIVSEDDLVIGEDAGDADIADILEMYVGKELKRTVYEGYKLNPSYVGKPVLVKRNSRVSMIYRAGALEIKAWGRALDEGGAGDAISVMNLESRKRVTGIITDDGHIEVGL